MISAAFGQPPQYDVADRRQTDFGEIQFVRKIDAEDFKGPPSTILLNGKVIFEGGVINPYLSFRGLYRASNGQVLLFSENCGGAGCRVDPLRLILLKKRSRPKHITADDFFSETLASEEIIGKSIAGKIVIDLGYFRGAKKTAIFDGRRLFIALVDDSARIIPNDQCVALYLAADACLRGHRSTHGCPDYTTTDFTTGGFLGSNAEIWAVRRASHYPGFNRRAFIQLCDAMCGSGESVSFERFKSDACNNGQ